MILIAVHETEIKKKVLTDTGVLVGTFEMDADGFFYFYYNGAGAWTSKTLRVIADKLDEVNKPFNDKIDKYFSENSCEDGEFDLDLWGAKY